MADAPKVTAIIQARAGSSRLPNKIMETLAGTTVLHHVLRRASAVSRVDVVCCAVPVGPANDRVAAEAERHGALVFRGSEADVLSRYQGAAELVGADVVVRITSDCPFIDPGVSGAVIERFLVGDVDYCSNVEQRSWPKGLDTEVFSREVLELAFRHAGTARQREHVTPWIRENPALRRANVLADHDWSALRWTLDYPEDLAFIRAVAEHVDLVSARFADILRVVTEHPELSRINGHLV